MNNTIFTAKIIPGQCFCWFNSCVLKNIKSTVSSRNKNNGNFMYKRPTYKSIKKANVAMLTVRGKMISG